MHFMRSRGLRHLILAAVILPWVLGRPVKVPQGAQGAADSASIGAGARALNKRFVQLGTEILMAVRTHFLDAARAEVWAAAHSGYANGVTEPARFEALTNSMLAELGSSHTHYYTPSDAAYFDLRAIFASALHARPIARESLGMDCARLQGDVFIRDVFLGGPAAGSGLRRGDRLLSANRLPFDPDRSLLGNEGREIALEVQRHAGSAPVLVRITPRLVEPQQEWLQMQKLSSRVIERYGMKIAYVRMFSCAGESYQDALQEAIVNEFHAADALVLDFRDGWGGCNPDFMNLFNPLLPVFTTIDRGGGRIVRDTQWRKPLYVLINGGSRSGKEVVASSIKRHRVGALVGQRTAGAVLQGRALLLSDQSLLYLAVADVLVDGERLEGRGVEPDVTVEDDLPYANGVDAQLEKALSLAGRGSKNGRYGV
jgi:carboxyl-terminal processing protease